jgi:hypothetical protein
MNRGSMRLAALLASTALVFVAVCGAEQSGDSTEAPPGPTVGPTTAPSATATPSAVTSLREVNFEETALAGPLIDAAGGGEVPNERVEFLDLIGGDGIEEAVVVVESGGTLGDLAAGVFVLIQGQPQLVQVIETAGRIEVRLDLVVAIEGVWASDDPQCCPSQLRETSYRWDGARFITITEQVVSNPGQ